MKIYLAAIFFIDVQMKSFFNKKDTEKTRGVKYENYVSWTFLFNNRNENGQRVMIDPFITGNPLTDLTGEEVKTDWLLITHGHSDHIGDMIPIANKIMPQLSVLLRLQIMRTAEE